MFLGENKIKKKQKQALFLKITRRHKISCDRTWILRTSELVKSLTDGQLDKGRVSATEVRNFFELINFPSLGENFQHRDSLINYLQLAICKTFFFPFLFLHFIFLASVVVCTCKRDSPPSSFARLKFVNYIRPIYKLI